MKLKDIKVDHDYAIGAPNVTFGRSSRSRTRVVRVGVYGTVRSTGGIRRQLSSHPNYVEIEVIEDPDSRRLGWMYEHHFASDGGGGEVSADDWGHRNKPSYTSYRCLASHVLMTWEQHLEDGRVRAERGLELKAQMDAVAQERADLERRFQELGFRCTSWSDHVRFTDDQAKLLLAFLEKSR